MQHTKNEILIGGVFEVLFICEFFVWEYFLCLRAT